jgi:methyltransferase (TIGR00027 family)
MYVASLRYVQSIHESPDRQNPDTLVRHFIPILNRFRTVWLGRRKLTELRADPFYYYLVARTKNYDQVLHDAVIAGAQRIVVVGCGSDTRAYRFMHFLRSKGVNVLECDQREAIYEKQRMARRLGRFDHVEYLPLDLNDDRWPELERSLGDRTGPQTLVLAEGVSPYVNDSDFTRFLRYLSAKLPTGSHIAYDFKIAGVWDDFGKGRRTQKPFRLPAGRGDVAAFHEAHSLRLERMELSSELFLRLLPDVAESGGPSFSEDALVQLQIK